VQVTQSTQQIIGDCLGLFIHQRFVRLVQDFSEIERDVLHDQDDCAQLAGIFEALPVDDNIVEVRCEDVVLL
jgi:hypothetical protein